MSDTTLNRGGSVGEYGVFSDTAREAQDHGAYMELDIAPIDENGDTLLNALDIDDSVIKVYTKSSYTNYKLAGT